MGTTSTPIPGLELAGRPVLVTGLNGFIGSTLGRRLGELGAVVTGSLRDPTRFDKPAAGLRLVAMDLKKPETFPGAVAGQDVVFHVAAWVGRGADGAEAHAINVDATRALVEAAHAARVRRFIYVSSIAAYGVPRADRVTESHPTDMDQRDPYGRTKALGERAALEAATGGPELVIIRPAMVYGPGSGAWTIGMVRLLQKGLPSLFGTADGHAYPVFVDNLVDALLLAATRPGIAGEAFHVADAPVTWQKWFSTYGSMTGRKPRRIPGFVASGLAVASELMPFLGLPLTRDRLALYRRRITFVTDKASDRLGWSSRVSYDEGMARSEAWLRESGRI